MPIQLITITCRDPACQRVAQKRCRSGDAPPQYCSRRCWYRVRRRLGARWRKYTWTEAEHARLREACRHYGGMKAAWRAGAFGDKPYGIVKREVKRLGIIRRMYEDSWAVEDDLLLLRLAAEGRALEVIQQRLRQAGCERSVGGIVCRLRQLGQRAKRGRYSLLDIAECLETDWHRVKSWVERGWLKATPTSGMPHARWYVRAADLREFLVEHRLDVVAGDMRLAWVLSLFEYDFPAAEPHEEDGYESSPEQVAD